MKREPSRAPLSAEPSDVNALLGALVHEVVRETEREGPRLTPEPSTAALTAAAPDPEPAVVERYVDHLFGEISTRSAALMDPEHAPTSHAPAPSPGLASLKHELSQALVSELSRARLPVTTTTPAVPSRQKSGPLAPEKSVVTAVLQGLLEFAVRLHRSWHCMHDHFFRRTGPITITL